MAETDYWAQALLPCAIDDVDGLPVVRRRLNGGHDFARARYQGAPGQDVEPLGRKPLMIDVDIAFYRNVSTDHYPGLLDALVAVLEDLGKAGEVEYFDQRLGPIPVIVRDWSVNEDAEARNGADVTLGLEERNDEKAASSADDPRGSSRLHAAAVDEELANTSITDAEIDAAMREAGYPLSDDELGSFPELFLTLTDNFFEILDQGALLASEVAWEVDRYRGRVDALLAFDAVQQVERWQLYHSAILLADTITRAADLVDDDSDSGPIEVQFTVPQPMSSVEISNLFYGHPRKASEIEQRNPTPNPLQYPEGAVLTLEGAS